MKAVVIFAQCLLALAISQQAIQPALAQNDKPAGVQTSAAEPLSLHPDNPHYFLFRGKPAVLITSGEHYGAVLNLDFDYIPYLDELKSKRFNLTRTFAGSYREVAGSFGIEQNTLAPAPGRYVCPWARSSASGANDGGNKFDLDKWDPAYFERLKGFISQAGKRGIVVELVLFCTMYDETLWAASPMCARNNVNGIGDVSPGEVYSLKDRRLVAAQEAMVRKIVAELNDFDNLYFEICNEPYERGGFAKEWNDRMVATIVAAESKLSAKHLIAEGIAVRAAKIVNPNPHVSIFNFHAATAESALLNYALNKPIADDETGAKGTSDLPYRREAWEFMLSGGAVFSHLDFSFTCKHPDGAVKVTTAPGGGGIELRKQLAILKELLEGFDFIKMQPNDAVVQGGRITRSPSGADLDLKKSVRVLAEPGIAYAIYVGAGMKAEPIIELPAGAYKAEWINTKTGKTEQADNFDHDGGTRKLVSPGYQEDIALRVLSSAK